MIFQSQIMKQSLRKPALICLLSSILLIFLFAGAARDSFAQDELQLEVAFKQEKYERTFAPKETGKVYVDVLVSAEEEAARRTGEIVVTYEVSSSDEIIAEVVSPWGEQTLTIPVGQSNGAITLTVNSHDGWAEGDKAVELKIKEVTSNDAVIIGEFDEMAITITRGTRALYLPSTLSHSGEANWKRIDLDDPNTKDANARSIAVCPGDSSVLYLGTDKGLFQWKANPRGWNSVTPNVPGSVRDVVFGDDCSHVYAAVLGVGVWGTHGANGAWCQLKGDAFVDELKTSFAVVVRGGFLYTGTEKGIYYYDRSQGCKEEWKLGLANKDISRLTLAGDRIFAAVWQEGVSYNDGCDANGCMWNSIPGPVGDEYIRDVIGRPPDKAGDKPDWMLIATASTTYRLENGNWLPPEENHATQPTGNVFSLAAGPGVYYAGVENGGVWATEHGGQTWLPVGGANSSALKEDIRDIAVTSDGTIYAATFNNGVWRWPSP